MSQQLHLFDGLSVYEGTDVEYKGALGGLPGNLWPTYSAFANTAGGTIWLGITQQEESLDVHGLDDAEKLVGDFWNTVNNRSKVNRNLLTSNNVNIVGLQESSRKVVAIEVPRASRRERPVYVGSDPFKGTYRRNFEGDYLCNEGEVRRMFADQSEEPADSRILEGFSFEDLHADSIKQFRNRFSSRAGDHSWLLEDDAGLLQKLGGWRRERHDGREGLTLAGLLMFGKTEATTAPEGVPGFHLDYRERLSDDRDVRWTDRLSLDGTWEGNLFQFYQRVVLKLGSGAEIKTPFRLDADGYRQGAAPLLEALQEALVNALIHADYSGQGGVVIDRYPDHFEFSNPGTLLVSREQLVRGGISECRNKSLQRMFQMLGVGDKAGSGLDKIRSSWAAQHWQSPSLQETLRPDRVRLLLPMVSMLPEDVVAVLRERFGERFASLDRDGAQVLVAAVTAGSVSNQRLQEMLPLHRVDITKLLQGLVRDGFLTPEGIGRGTRYMLAGEAPAASAASREVIPPVSGRIPPVNGGTPPVSGGVLPATAHDPAKDPQLLEIARPVRDSARSSAAVVTETILKLCDGRILTLRELSRLLDRKPEGLRDGYLTRLVRDGKLDLRHPEKPSHRQQAYRSRQP